MAIKDIKYKNKIYSLSYELQNLSKKRVILFLHGWGSNKDIMKQAFSKYLSNYKHIYLDMPGFGNSSIEEVITTKDYANIVKEFLKSLHVEANCVVGHSFGGKVASLLNPDSLILLSSAGIKREKSLKIKFNFLFSLITYKGINGFISSCLLSRVK